ncbi:MAG: hypothetical protein ACON5H_08125 [Akkermansiaceae bacterium]
MKPSQILRVLTPVFLLLKLNPASAITLGPQPSPTVTPGSPNNFFLDWQAVAGRTYFMQCSTDMQNWDYVPDVWLGQGQPLAYEIQGSGGGVFVRLAYTDIPVTNPGEADYDQDGYTTDYELANGMDPLVFNAGGNLTTPIGSTPVPPSTTPIAGAAFQLIVKTEATFQSTVKTIDLDEHLQAIAVDGAAVANGFPLGLASHSHNGPFKITVFLVRVPGAPVTEAKMQLLEYQDYIEYHPPHDQIKKAQVHPPLILSAAQGNPHFEITEEFVPYFYTRDLLPVDLEKISFDGTEYYELKKDDLTETYSAPHWIKADGTNESVAFKRNSKPKIEVFFKLDAPDDLLAKIKIKGVASDGIEFPDQNLVKDGGSVKYPMKEASSAFPNTIKFYDRSDDAKAFKIDWQISVDEGAFSSIGESKHQVYLTLEKPATALKQETVYYLGCNEASGLTNHQQIVDAVYSEFQDQSVQRVNPANGDPDGRDMTYWGPPPQQIFDPATLLKQGDGKCGAWGRLMVEILKVHSINSAEKAILPPLYTLNDLQASAGANLPAGSSFQFDPANARLFVKNWNTAGNAFQPVDLKGIGAQGNMDPHSRFTDHCVVEYDGKIYDPSYGTGPFANQLAWEDASIEAFGGLVTVTLPNGQRGTFNWIWKNDPKGTQETR